MRRIHNGYFTKFLTGWVAHLYYWVYPGVMVAFMGILVDTSLRHFGYQPTPFGQIILAISCAAFIGFLALRGITGSTVSSVVLNTLQLLTLGVFVVLAILFRSIAPTELAGSLTFGVGNVPLDPWDHDYQYSTDSQRQSFSLFCKGRMSDDADVSDDIYLGR